jgi:hypothetical protein
MVGKPLTLAQAAAELGRGSACLKAKDTVPDGTPFLMGFNAIDSSLPWASGPLATRAAVRHSKISSREMNLIRENHT